MRTFQCTCGNPAYFENDQCFQCGRKLAFDPIQMRMLAFNDADIDPDTKIWWGSNGKQRKAYRPCDNDTNFNTCNWLVEASDNASTLCLSCSLNEVIPDLDVPRRIGLWYDVEKAKRRMIFTLLALHLPIVGKRDDPGGLAFKIIADGRLDGDQIGTDEQVYTGHFNGLITLNLMEADPEMRMQMRESMNESYRTLLGHFRHESGHYYWNVLVSRKPPLDDFRALFGDEQVDYRASLDAHYKNGPPSDWGAKHISAYAACHPLEDFAETWAHYMHMVDTLETANDSGTQLSGRELANPLQARSLQLQFSIPYSVEFDRIQSDWSALTHALNRLNRSMGLDDAYPFSVTPVVAEKLRYIHQLIHAL